MSLFTKLWPNLRFRFSRNSHTINVTNHDIVKTKVESENKIPTIIQNNQDLSGITPYFPATFNVAAYVNNSDTLKKLVNMNVDISKIEKKPYILEKFLKLDFDRDMKDIIFFLSDYVKNYKVVDLITKNPMIFEESLKDIEVRVNYLVQKRFTRNQIQHILAKNPYWLMFSTQRIDRRLGHFQDYYKLSGEEVRSLASNQPRIITYNLHHIKTNTFVIKEEMGFEDHEMKSLLLKKAKLWLMNQRSLLSRFNYLHNVIKIPHGTLLKYPQILECRTFKIKQRHMFLEKLGRAQFDPKKENYVPLMALAEGTDVDFCRNYAKCSVSDFNMFLKTL